MDYSTASKLFSLPPDPTPPTISVVVPVWNAEKYLRAALDTIRFQTFIQFEVILVNDGSTDDSESICLEYCKRDPRFILISLPNSGVSTARNVGIEAARADWITFMDADDMMMPRCLETLYAALDYDLAKIVVGSFRKGDNRKLDNWICRKKRRQKFPRLIHADKAIEIGLYQKRILNNPWGAVYHRELFFGKNPLRFRDCRYEDLDLFYRAFDRLEYVAITDEVIYLYRDNPGSFINTWSDSRLDVLDVTDRMVEYFKMRNWRLHKAALDRRFSAHFNMLVEMFRYKIDDEEQISRCWNVVKGQRGRALVNPRVRLKNKLGALYSYLGLPAIKLLCRF